MRQKKVSHRRTEVRVDAVNYDGRWEVRVFDAAGLVAKTYCTSRNNVAFKATQAAASALDVPEGRIKINRVEYA